MEARHRSRAAAAGTRCGCRDREGGKGRAHIEHAWADPEAGLVHCLTEGPTPEAVARAHERGGGAKPDEIHPVPLTV
ncbi:nickel-binding protein [Streptomyces sp. TRM68367]|uniref:nickel-binding protein n=1 Tax=Streptomyces sp. TRM68367 TaxID=2758415 RepID=UPI00165B380A|nr:nickel-binding protein [Streptomyces sp. TRM68367]MBC9728916.1 DUF4242 domain-containing protein [Streptomyces sp. TRM68367]